MKLNNLLFSIVIFNLFFNIPLLSQDLKRNASPSKEDVMLMLAKAQADRKKLLLSLLDASPQGLPLTPAEPSAINVRVKNNHENANNVLAQTYTQANTESSYTQKTQEKTQAPAPGSLNSYQKIVLNSIYVGSYAVLIASFATPGGSLYLPALMAYHTIVPTTLLIGALNCFV